MSDGLQRIYSLTLRKTRAHYREEHELLYDLLIGVESNSQFTLCMLKQGTEENEFYIVPILLLFDQRFGSYSTVGYEVVVSANKTLSATPSK